MYMIIKENQVVWLDKIFAFGRQMAETGFRNKRGRDPDPAAEIIRQVAPALQCGSKELNKQG